MKFQIYKNGYFPADGEFIKIIPSNYHNNGKHLLEIPVYRFQTAFQKENLLLIDKFLSKN